MEKDTFFFNFFRFWVKQALQFYCKRISVTGLENIPNDKPVLLCPTHSNSFLDAFYLCVYLDSPIHPLARGDAFKKTAIDNVLRQFKMLPIFRQTDGESDAFNKNEASFEECQQLFLKNKKVLIFPEGICKHQKEVLPLKKGASVLAQRAWNAGIDLQVVPIGITYNNFFSWGKKCDIIIGKKIIKTEFEITENASFNREFNGKLFSEMKMLYPSPFQFKNNKVFRSPWLPIQYFLGWCINAPIYGISYLLVKKLTKGTIFHDSAIVGMLALLLPVYYLAIAFTFLICYW
ncbi:MAG: 1-acyl-sn-glycerol-3-phosphate acyltransferase [Saprospiraceae bacterium]